MTAQSLFWISYTHKNKQGTYGMTLDLYTVYPYACNFYADTFTIHMHADQMYKGAYTFHQ